MLVDIIVRSVLLVVFFNSKSISLSHLLIHNRSCKTIQSIDLYISNRIPIVLLFLLTFFPIFNSFFCCIHI